MMYTVVIREPYGEHVEHRSNHSAGAGETALSAVQKAVKKAYGSATHFDGQKVGGGWSGQVWKPCSTGGLTSVTPLIWIEAEPKRSGAPLVENRSDWAGVDWAKPNAQIARELGVARQTVAAQRKRHGS